MGRQDIKCPRYGPWIHDKHGSSKVEFDCFITSSSSCLLNAEKINNAKGWDAEI